MSSPRNSIVPERARSRPEQRAQQRALAGAVGADQAHGLALVDVQVDPPQHLDVAIAGVRLVTLQQRRRHWRTIWRSAKREPR